MSARDPFDLQGQEDEQADKKRLESFSRREVSDDLNRVMSDKSGRRFVFGLIEKTGVFRSSFTGSSETFFREGQRSIGLHIYEMLQAFCPEKYALMLKEQKDRCKTKS